MPIMGSGDTGQDDRVAARPAGVDPSLLVPYMCALMLRNITTGGFRLADHNQSGAPPAPGSFASVGSILASPSWNVCVNGVCGDYPGNVAPIDQDYAFNWVRDSSVTVAEVLNWAPSVIPASAATAVLANYVRFASRCQSADTSRIGQAYYSPEGNIPLVNYRPDYRDEADGPALRIITILQGFGNLDIDSQAVARQVLERDLQYLFFGQPPVYANPTLNLWEDHSGLTIFAQSVQLKCIRLMRDNTFGIEPPEGTEAAVVALEASLSGYRTAGPDSCYQGLSPAAESYDPSIDPILACMYGEGLSCTDEALLATTARLRRLWTASPDAYGVNVTDKKRDIGPLFGRYAGDRYNGDSIAADVGHPWAVCSCSVAWLYYTLANTIAGGSDVPTNPLAGEFFAQVGINDLGTASAKAVVGALRSAGDSVLNAVVYHSNDYELSEQFDKDTGVERSVSNLTWSYAAFLAAVRARPGD